MSLTSVWNTEMAGAVRWTAPGLEAVEPVPEPVIELPPPPSVEDLQAINALLAR